MKPARLVPAGIVLLALGAIAGAAQLAGPAVTASGRATASGPAAAVSRQVAVASAVRACPPAQGGTGTVALIAAPGGPAGAANAANAANAAKAANAAGSGQAELAPLPSAGAQPRTAGPAPQKTPGVLSVLTLPAGKGTQGWSVTASGPMAQAMEAELAQPSGVASVRCGAPASDVWFAGPGPRNGAAQLRLDLMNIDALPASVTVNIITDAGPVQAGNDTGITVPPRRTVTESLAAPAADASVVAVEVRTTTGRVVADVSESGSGGTASWLPSAAAPSTRLVIPGIPASGHSAGLFLVVPGGLNAKVSVLAITPQGQYRPFGTQTVELPAESASFVALTPLGGTAAALQITANVPVTAGVQVPGSGTGAFTTATAPVSEQAVVAGDVTGTGAAASVALSAPAGAARVRLTESAAASSAKLGRSVTASQVVQVRAGHTLVAPVTAPRGARRGSAFAVVITPLAGSGPLYAARIETQGQGAVVSIIPAISAFTTITLPPARDSYTAILP